MSKRNIKNITLLLLLFIYSFVYKIYICRNITEYSESITVAFILLYTFLSINLLGFQKSGNSKIKQTITKDIFIFVIIYYVLLFILGICKGFVSNIYINSFESLLYTSVILISIELFRYVMIRANIDKKYIAVITTIVITIFETLYFKDYNLLEIASKNILLSCLVYNIGLIPGIIYIAGMNVFKNIIPIHPNISNYLDSFLYIITSLISYLFVSKKVNKYNISNGKNKTNRLFDISFITFIIVIICLVTQLFPYCIIGIGSGSMEPELSLGDAVIVHKLSKNEKINEGQIIVYNADNIQVVHRVVEIKNKNSKTIYKTKGDANDSVDDIEITIDDIYGVVKFKIPLIATPTVLFNKLLNGD